MAIKVLDRKEPPQELKKYKVRCSHCKSTIELTEDDGELVERGTEVGILFECPVCSSRIVATIGHVDPPSINIEDILSEIRHMTLREQIEGMCPDCGMFHG